VKYLNNIIEQDHRFIKKITEPMMNFKAFHSASAALAGIELAASIRQLTKPMSRSKESGSTFTKRLINMAEPLIYICHRLVMQQQRSAS
jgi:hypothetical protein